MWQNWPISRSCVWQNWPISWLNCACDKIDQSAGFTHDKNWLISWLISWSCMWLNWPISLLWSLWNLAVQVQVFGNLWDGPNPPAKINKLHQLCCVGTEEVAKSSIRHLRSCGWSCDQSWPIRWLCQNVDSLKRLPGHLIWSAAPVHNYTEVGGSCDQIKVVWKLPIIMHLLSFIREGSCTRSSRIQLINVITSLSMEMKIFCDDMILMSI